MSDGEENVLPSNVANLVRSGGVVSSLRADLHDLRVASCLVRRGRQTRLSGKKLQWSAAEQKSLNNSMNIRCGAHCVGRLWFNVSLFGLLRFIFLLRNFPSERSSVVMMAVISVTVVVPAVLGTFNNSPFRRLSVAIFVVAFVPGIPVLYGWTTVFGTYASHHWLEVPLDFVSMVFGSLVITRMVQRKAWRSLS